MPKEKFSFRMSEEEWRNRFKSGELDKYETPTKFLSGSTLDKLFDVVALPSYFSGGHELEKAKRLEEAYADYPEGSVERKQAVMKVSSEFASPWFAALKAVGDPQLRRSIQFSVQHRVEPSRVHDDTFAMGLGRNIVSDPSSFITGVGGLIKGGGRAAFRKIPTYAQKPIQFGLTKIEAGQEILGAGKTQITNSAMRRMGAGYGWISTRLSQAKGKVVGTSRSARDLFGEIFEPGYKLKKSGGPGAEYFKSYMDMVVSKRGAITQAFYEVKEMGRPYKRSGELAMDYVERGVSTGVEGLDKYLDDVVRPYLTDIRTRELAAGYDIGEIAGYVPHVLSSKGKELISKYGTEEGVIKYLKDQAQIKYGRERQLPGSVSEINELLGDEFFISDLWQAVGVRVQRSASDLATTSWLEDVVKKYGLEETGETTRKVYTQGALKARGKIEEYRGIAEAFQRAVTDISAGRAAPLFMENWVTTASRGTFRGMKEDVSMRVRQMRERSESVIGAKTSLSTAKSDITMLGSQLTTELARGGERAGTISRVAVESLQASLDDVMQKIPGKEDAVRRAQERARSDLMQIGSEIIDPLQRKISGLQDAASRTKSVKILKDAVEEGTEYIRTKRQDIDVMLPENIAKHLDELETVEMAMSPVKKADVVHNKLMNLWKRSVTLGFGPLVFTSFFARNIFTGVSQNIQQVGIKKTLEGMYDAARLWRGKGVFKTFEGGEVDAVAMERLMRESGQMGGTGMSDIALSEKMYPTFTEKLWDLGGQAMRWSEATVREPLFLIEIRTKTLKEAAESIKETHFDYAMEALTPTERIIKGYGIPFYTFTRFNLERQLKQLHEKPLQFERLGQIQRESIRTAGLEEEYARRPEWQEDSYLVANPLNQEQFISLAVPQLGVLGTGNPYFQLSPFKSALEYLAIDAGWGSDEYKKERKEALLKQMAGGRYISTRKKLLDPEIEQQQKLLYMAGFQTYTPAPETTSMTQFEQYRYRLIEPTKKQEFEAWRAAGMPERFVVEQIEPPMGAMGTAKDIVTKAKWWERLIGRKDTVVKALVRDYQLAVLSPEIRDMGRGYPWTEAERVKIQNLKGQELTTAVTNIYRGWDEWKSAQYGIAPATTQERMAAWIRSGEPGDATDKVYRNAAGKIIGIASFERGEIEKINDYVNRHIRISNAAYEWAFTQTDVTPEEFILRELDKENSKYLAAQAAQEELRGFDVDQPIPAGEVNLTQQIEYSQYRQHRVDYEQELIEKAMGRGEVI